MKLRKAFKIYKVKRSPSKFLYLFRAGTPCKEEQAAVRIKHYLMNGGWKLIETNEDHYYFEQ